MPGPYVHDMTHEAVKVLNLFAPYLNAALKPLGFQFVLVIAEVGKPAGAGQASYIANNERADTIRILRETADAMERGA